MVFKPVFAFKKQLASLRSGGGGDGIGGRRSGGSGISGYFGSTRSGGGGSGRGNANGAEGRVVTPGCQIGYVDHTGCHQLNRVLTAK
jgi:hypothetical protein